jgi:uncharacterized protein YcnI
MARIRVLQGQVPMKKTLGLSLCATAVLAAASPALAHVDLVNDQASPGEFIATFQVPHGCDGAATTAIRVQIPAGVYDVKPMPKSGWKLAIQTGKYAVPFTDGGQTISQGVTEVSWTGGNLPDSEYDQFTFYTVLADSLAKGSTVYFPVVQECEKGAVARWIQIPAAGKSEDDYPNPAPGLKIAP